MIPTLHKIQSLLGPCALLPIARNEKRPRRADWEKVTSSSLDDPDYLKLFIDGDNVGVSLGKASNGLCSIDFDDAGIGEKFLGLNPGLKVSLRTTRVRGFNIWIRIAGDFPASGKLKLVSNRKISIGEWRATGNQTVIHGAAMDASKGEKMPTAYRRLVDAAPVELPFCDIAWPEELWLPWQPDTAAVPPTNAYRELVDLHGSPYAVSEKGGVTLNDVFFASKYAVEHRIIFDPGEGRFFQYVQPRGLWQEQTSAALKIRFAEELKRYADTQSGLEQKIINKRSERYLGELVRLLNGIVEKRNLFEHSPGVIHAGNGMLHLDVNPPELRSFNADYFSRNACPLPFDPGAQCPQFQQELLDSALEEDDISLVQRYSGSLLLGNNLAQKLLALTGTAGGGKSTLLEIIEYVIGQENVAQLRTELLTERFEIARFIGKRLLTGKDVTGDFLQTPGAHVLKSLVGHDLLSAELKHVNGDTPVRGNFGVIITCNSRLRVRLDGDTEAWRRRLLIVKYERPKPTRPQRDFANALLATEGAGILRWMIEGAIAHLQELNTTGEFFLTDRQRRRINSLLAESDSVREFARRCVIRKAGSDVATHELVEAYSTFCEAMGWEPISTRRVENALADAMQEVHRAAKRNDISRSGKSRRGFSGLDILPMEEDVEP